MPGLQLSWLGLSLPYLDKAHWASPRCSSSLYTRMDPRGHHFPSPRRSEDRLGEGRPEEEMDDMPSPKASSSSCHPVRGLLGQDLSRGPLLSEATAKPWDLKVK